MVDPWVELEKLKAENARKDAMIAALLKEKELPTISDENLVSSSQPPQQQQLQPPPKVETFAVEDAERQQQLPQHVFAVEDAAESMNQWFFSRGVGLSDVSVLLSDYSEFVRSLGIQLDRLFIGAVMLHPKAAAYVWKYENGREYQEQEIPERLWIDVHEKLSPDEPFNVLRLGKASSVRMVASQESFPPDCKWFRDDKYQDYFALPILRKGEFKGAIGWATKKENGFSPSHIEFFQKSMPSFSFVMRQNINESIMLTLTCRLEEEIKERTSELAEANRNLSQANERILQQANAQLKHFAMMSHEIRTPLNGIIGLSSLLKETASTREQGELINMLTSSSDLLLRIVNDVLDYSKLVSGKFEMSIQPTCLSEIFESVLCNVQAKATERRVSVRSHIAKDLPPSIDTDGSRLQQIMYNLLGNAVKFSKQGDFVDFTVSNNVVENGDHFLKLVIKDYGKGIKKENFTSVFQPFLQAHSDEHFEYGGTGLGLAIVNKIVDAFGGSISVDSEVGKFTEFVVHIPFVISNEYDPSSRAKKRLKTDLSQNVVQKLSPDQRLEACQGKVGNIVTETVAAPSNRMVRRDSSSPDLVSDKVKILIAEDNLINQKLLKRILQRLGMEDVHVVENGMQAVEISAEKVFDLVFMDMHMPVMDGIEAARLIKQRKGQKTPIIVFLTAHATDEFRQQAEDVGADDFVPKPYNMERIRELVSTLGRSS